jgi:hypothetical protein
MQVKTKLSPDELRVAATKFGLTKEEFDTLTIHVLAASCQVTVYPDGNPRGHQFLDHLLDTGRGE